MEQHRHRKEFLERYIVEREPSAAVVWAERVLGRSTSNLRQAISVFNRSPGHALAGIPTSFVADMFGNGDPLVGYSAPGAGISVDTSFLGGALSHLFSV